jgi:hypothetical protein
MSATSFSEARPTFSDAISFSVRSNYLKLRRLTKEIAGGPKKRQNTTVLRDAPIVAESRTPLRTGGNESATLVLGKIQNLRVAARALNGIVIPANEVFSFWRQVGRPTKWKGYIVGREVREGCIIPTIGGGLCQLSNALYDAALKAGFVIVERHAHTRVIPGSLAEVGRDATVFWNYVDLRFISVDDFRIEVELSSHDLIVRFRAVKKSRDSIASLPQLTVQSLDHDCLNCGVVSCFRHSTESLHSKNAYVLDAYWPEFDRYLSGSERSSLWLLPYQRTHGRHTAEEYHPTGVTNRAYIPALRRAWALRHLPAQGGALQKTLLQCDEQLAKAFATHISYDIDHIVLSQNLLMPLHALGALQGRTYDVLMTRLPIFELQNILDRAKQLHSESGTLSDFRVPAEIASLELSLLKNAAKLISPHTEVARLFPHQVELLDWKSPAPVHNNDGPRDLAVFPYSTLGRKGAYEMRDAMHSLSTPIGVLDRNLESGDFWNNQNVVRLSPKDILRRAKVIVAPAFVEHQPRLLVEAIANCIPVIATRECGLSNHNVIEIRSGHPEDILDALRSIGIS